MPLSHDQYLFLKRKFANKECLWTFMKEKAVSTHFDPHLLPLQAMWLPALENTPLNFLQDVVEGKKKLFPDAQVKKIKLIRWPEFAVKHIWPHALKNPLFLDYIPSGWGIDGGGRKPEKLYVWGIICTLEHRWINENLIRIDAARINHRNEHRLVKEPDIKLDPWWAQ